MVNRVSSYFPKDSHSATETELKNNMNTRKVKRHQYSDTKTVNREPNKTTALERSVMNYWVGGGGGLIKLVLRRKPHTGRVFEVVQSI